MEHFNRRAALRLGGLGLMGLGFPQFLRATERSKSKAKVKSIIFLHQWGGPGQHETFDPKPDAPDNVRGWYHKPIDTAVPGVQICEKLPEVAKIMDRLCVIRCMQHATKMNNHNSAGYYSLTGVAPPTDDQRLRDSNDLFPAYGSVVAKLTPAEKGIASFVSFPHTINDGSITPGQQASFLGKAFNPLFVSDDPNAEGFRLPELTLPEGVSPQRLERRTELLKIVDDQARLLERSAVAKGVDDSYQQAVALLTSKTFRQAFDLTKEPKAMRERYGRTTYGQSCLLARRLVEAGAKFINVYFARVIGGAGGGWDYHGFNKESVTDRLKELLPITDRTLSTLVLDLDDCGLLDSTLVVWAGEFGRTPKISGNGGRDHWPACYTTVLAGGGTKAGFVYGKSDKQAASPTDGRVTPEDLPATMFDRLGLDPETELRDAQNRPVPVSRGSIVKDILA